TADVFAPAVYQLIIKLLLYFFVFCISYTAVVLAAALLLLLLSIATTLVGTCSIHFFACSLPCVVQFFRSFIYSVEIFSFVGFFQLCNCSFDGCFLIG